MKKQLLLIALSFLSISLYGQDFIWGMQYKHGIATGDFAAAAGRLQTPEFAIYTNYQIPNQPVEIGISVGYGINGTALEKRNDLYVGFNDELRLRRNNNLLSLAGVFRFFPEVYGSIFPFLEAQVGGIHAYTRYKIRENATAEPIENEKDLGSWARMSQIGGGVFIPLGEKIKGNLELRLMYQHTSPLDYLTKNDVRYEPDPNGVENGQFIYNVRRSPLNMIQPSIGINFYID
ncbi:hypothetical protein ACFOUP_00990 [Belliella kenyensis]|uniref:Outer membrane protein beta-barrel domain-containing protein n=1 Tax=Belliella kenyensis TaxID=1472724 RepID=A0ABV8EFA5_9BACT|nr:hypothetical protein [Belliella kenyensis]MCH7401728.1 hypothetical protein [Belliella kenyensis]MDN3604228.1 hypothetical protein [Belliella kenyensis]